MALKILVRVPNWLGDAIMALPALEELRRCSSDAEITVLARPWVSKIYANLPFVDEVLLYPEEHISQFLGPRLKLTALTPMIRVLRERRFDQAILFQNATEAALLAFLAGIPERIGYRTQLRGRLLTSRPRPRTRRRNPLGSWLYRNSIRFISDSPPTRPVGSPRFDHEALYYLDLLFQTGLTSRDYLRSQSFNPKVRIKATPASVEKAKKRLESASVDVNLPLVVIHPGSAAGPARRWPVQHFAEVCVGDLPLVVIHPGSAAGPARRWPVQHFAEVCRRLTQTAQLHLLILGWEREEAIAGQVARGIENRATIISGPVDLETTMGLISLASLVIANNSGAMHLAAALGVPLVALFGSTDPSASGPLAENAIAHFKPVKCSPCHLRECPIDMRCWDGVEINEVFNSASTLLNRFS